MNYLSIIGLAAAFAAAGAPALAQGAPPPPNPAMRQQFQQMRTQMDAIRTNERSAILGALTPAHKALLASVVGQLATSVNPDFDAAATQLDSALSSGEKTAIVSAAQNARSRQRSLMQNLRSQMPMPVGPPRTPRTSDAGRILLQLATVHPEMRMRAPNSLR